MAKLQKYSKIMLSLCKKALVAPKHLVFSHGCYKILQIKRLKVSNIDKLLVIETFGC